MAPNKQLAPLIIFAYNRPLHLKKTLDALQLDPLSDYTVVYFFCDGPKSATDAKAVSEVRKIIENQRVFPKSIVSLAEANKGLANSVIYGVSEVLKKHGEAIILEDDIIVSAGFLSFMNIMLDKFEARKDIYSVTGYNYPLDYTGVEIEPIYLSYRSSSWGWGTWLDRWESTDWELTTFNDFKKDNIRLSRFARGGEDLFQMLEMQTRGLLDSWSIRFDFAHFENNATCAHPSISLVDNIGFDGSGTHGVFTNEYSARIPLDAWIPLPINPNLQISASMLGPFDQKFRPANYSQNSHNLGLQNKTSSIPKLFRRLGRKLRVY